MTVITGIRTCMVVQWLRFHAADGGGVGLIPGQGTKIPPATRHSWKINKWQRHLTQHGWEGVVSRQPSQGRLPKGSTFWERGPSQVKQGHVCHLKGSTSTLQVGRSVLMNNELEHVFRCCCLVAKSCPTLLWCHGLSFQMNMSQMHLSPLSQGLVP